MEKAPIDAVRFAAPILLGISVRSGGLEELAPGLRATLAQHAARVEHVGSTSVPGLAAKPVIDIDVVVESSDLLPTIAR